MTKFPGITSASWGYTVETSTMAVRMCMSGVFDQFPNLKIIIGHMGEGLPFSLWRIDYTLRRAGNAPIDFRACSRSTSGSRRRATSARRP